MIRWELLREGRTWRGVGLVMLVAVLFSAPWWAPRALSRLTFFDVRHVDVAGTRLLEPANVVAMMDIDSTLSVWGDHTAMAARIAEHPQIAEAHISKRLPSTLVVRVREVPPVAFISTPRGLRALDERGDTLPLDPLRVDASLPIVARTDTTILQLLGALREDAPALFDRISEVRREAGDELTLIMPPLRVRARTDLSSSRLSDILPVERDLARRQARVVELDLRYRDQVVARVQ
ncbi:MAG TPA: FtsQ-type POTRA domain-containing protein [Gemmatimonadaceae bacterium]|nr:FtsQ-type POTRA domain-containing protein [Gemmatimonadaceae bacterium]